MKYAINGKHYDLNYIIEMEGFDIWLQNPKDDADTVELFELSMLDQESVEDLVLKAARR